MEPGNISTLVQHSRVARSGVSHPSRALTVVANQVNAAGPWLLGREALAVNRLGLVVIIGQWAIAIRLAWLHRQRSALHLHGLLVVAVLLGSASVTRIFGGYFEYTVRWWWVITALIVAGSLWTIAGKASRHVVVAGMLVAISVVAAVGAAQFVDRVKLPGAVDSEMVGALAGPTVDGLRAGGFDGKVLMRWWDPHYLGASAFGLVLELERRGIDVGVDPPFSAAALPQRCPPRVRCRRGGLPGDRTADRQDS